MSDDQTTPDGVPEIVEDDLIGDPVPFERELFITSGREADGTLVQTSGVGGIDPDLLAPTNLTEDSFAAAVQEQYAALTATPEGAQEQADAYLKQYDEARTRFLAATGMTETDFGILFGSAIDDTQIG